MPPVESWLPPEPVRLPAVDAVATATVREATASPEINLAGNPTWLALGDLSALVVIGGLLFMDIASTGGVLRLLFALLFVTWVPGWALVRASGLAGGLTGAAVAVLASLTICAVASTTMVWLSAWHPFALLAGLAGVSGVAILWTMPPALVAARISR